MTCDGPITVEELIAKTQRNVKDWAKNKKNEMDKRHTPGPWKWFSHVEGESEKAKKSGKLRKDWFYELGLENDEGEEVFIVECDGCWSEWLIRSGNMALIAAAPEMLEALEKVKEYIEHSMNYGILAGVPEFVESAIKKARGGENKLEEAEEDLEEDLEGFIEEYNEQHVDDFAPGDGEPFEYSAIGEEC